MTPLEIAEAINLLENKFRVDKWVIDDLHVWPLVRMSLKYSLFFRHLTPQNKLGMTARSRLSQIPTVAKRNYQLLYSYLTDYKNNGDDCVPCDAIFLTFTLDRLCLDGIYYNKYCDPYIDVLHKLNRKTLTLEMGVGGEQYRIPRYKPSVYIQHIIDFIHLKNIVFPTSTEDRNICLAAYDDFIGFSWDQWDIGVPGYRELVYKVNCISEMAQYFKKILLNTKPTVVFLSEYYNRVAFAMNVACRELGITTVDIQHGTAGEYHNSYGRWNRVPLSGYEMLPSIFWCWSDEDAKAIYTWSSKVSTFHKPFVGGDLWLNLWKKGNDDLIRKVEEKLDDIKSNFNKHVLVLYTHDIFYGIPNWLLDIMKSLPSVYQWLVRLHPTQHTHKESVRRLLLTRGIKEFEIDRATDLPLPALLRHADILVTATSTTVIEANAFGVPSIVTHEDAEVYHGNLIRSGAVVTAYCAKDFRIALEKQLERRRDSSEGMLGLPTMDNLSVINDFFAMIKTV